MTTLIVIVAGAAMLLFYGVSIYNRLIMFRNRVQEAWSDIDVQLKRRYDLIPNIVETVKGYAAHEKGTLESVIAARNAAMSDHGDPAQRAQSQAALQNSLKGLFALAESYPALKANENFLNLQNQLSEIEETIQKARRYYNGSVREMNNLIEQFPSNIIASRYDFARGSYFELDPAQAAAKEPVAVKF